jgi:hypothetical protein
MAAAAMVAQPSGKDCDISLLGLKKSGAAMVVGSRCK